MSVFLFSFVSGAPAVRAAQPAAVTASAGRFNVLNRDPLVEIGWEASFAPRRYHWLPRWAPPLTPAVGGMATAKGSLYAYGGFRFDLPVGECWMLSPQWATGLYYQDGGRGLGGALEFRSGIELSRRIGGKVRVGLLLYHISNGGLYNRNPGSESLLFTYTTPP
jgi:lipid A 3-O-deacylase